MGMASAFFMGSGYSPLGEIAAREAMVCAGNDDGL